MPDQPRHRPARRVDAGTPTHLAFAQHIRGTITQGTRTAGGRPHFWFTVTNTSNGIQIARSDAFTFDDAMQQCTEVVAVARLAAFWDVSSHDLKAGTPKTLKIGQGDAQAIMTLVVGGVPYDLERLVSRMGALLG